MIIHFEEMDVEVSQDNYIHEWTAWGAGTYDCDFNGESFVVTCPMGYGSTMMEAIVDLREKLKETA
jgi:hypothetical protein